MARKAKPKSDHGGKRHGAGRKNTFCPHEVFLAVEDNRARLRPEYEARAFDVASNRYTRGARQLVGGDGDLSLSEALQGLNRATRKQVSAAFSAMDAGSDELANKILDDAMEQYLLEAERAEAIFEGWKHLCRKNRRGFTLKKWAVRDANGEVVLLMPPGLLAAACRAAVSDLAQRHGKTIKPKRAKEIWLSEYLWIESNLKPIEPDT